MQTEIEAPKCNYCGGSGKVRDWRRYGSSATIGCDSCEGTGVDKDFSIFGMALYVSLQESVKELLPDSTSDQRQEVIMSTVAKTFEIRKKFLDKSPKRK